MDITVLEVQTNGKVKQIAPSSGGPWGGIYVDNKLRDLLDKVFKKEHMDAFRKKLPNVWMSMMLDWEVKKKSAAPTGKSVNLSVNAEFATFIQEKAKKTIPEILKENKESGLSFSCGLLRVKAEKVCEIFNDVIKLTIDHLKELLEQPKVKAIKCIFIVGGFGESTFLQQRIREEFETEDRAVLIPSDASLCVIKGAVLFGHSPNAISSRIALRTYCVRTTRVFKPGDNPEHIIADSTDGKKRIHYLRPLVTMNDEISDDHEAKITTRPVAANQSSVKFKIYTAKKMEVNNPYDEDVNELGEVVISVPPNRPKTENEIELKMQYGGTSVKVIATHKANGQEEVVELKMPEK